MNNKKDEFRERAMNKENLKDISGGYSDDDYTCWVDDSICNKKCNEISCKVTKFCVAMEVVWVPGPHCNLLRRVIDPLSCFNCGSCIDECHYGAIKSITKLKLQCCKTSLY